ncbi:MAG TPA: signal peptidase II [Planctomycetota bacterium]|nr:signal peptidase II [Planctomycetota bacterium]
MAPLTLIYRWKRTLLILAILFSCVSCDQVSKQLAVEHLADGEALSFAGDTLRVQYAENPGAFLGLFDGLPERARTLLLSYTVAAALVLFFVYLLRDRALSRSSLIGCALICGGGFGNLIDRFTRSGYVIDFLNCGVGSLRTGIFNVADMAITGGVIWLILKSAFGRFLDRPLA